VCVCVCVCVCVHVRNIIITNLLIKSMHDFHVLRITFNINVLLTCALGGKNASCGL